MARLRTRLGRIQPELMRRPDTAGAGALRPFESQSDDDDELLLPDSLGARLRAERLRRNVSIASIAESTKILGALLEGLEHDDVSRWPSGLYRRAFIRAYAVCDRAGSRARRPGIPGTVPGSGGRARPAPTCVGNGRRAAFAADHASAHAGRRASRGRAQRHFRRASPARLGRGLRRVRAERGRPDDVSGARVVLGAALAGRGDLLLRQHPRPRQHAGQLHLRAAAAAIRIDRRAGRTAPVAPSAVSASFCTSRIGRKRPSSEPALRCQCQGADVHMPVRTLHRSTQALRHLEYAIPLSTACFPCAWRRTTLGDPAAVRSRDVAHAARLPAGRSRARPRRGIGIFVGDARAIRLPGRGRRSGSLVATQHPPASDVRPDADRGPVHVAVGIAERLPFADRSFDGAVGLNGCTRVPDLARASERNLRDRTGAAARVRASSAASQGSTISRIRTPCAPFASTARTIGRSTSSSSWRSRRRSGSRGRCCRRRCTRRSALVPLRRSRHVPHAAGIRARQARPTKASCRSFTGSTPTRCSIRDGERDADVEESGETSLRARGRVAWRAGYAPGETGTLTAVAANVGDTIWLADPSPLGGFVTVGCKLTTPSGRLVSDTIGRTFLAADVRARRQGDGRHPTPDSQPT